MKKLLTLKHWQLFGLLMGLPLIFQLVAMGSIMNNNNPTMVFIAFPIMLVLLIVFFYGWFYALGTNLHKMLPPTVTMNLSRFKLFLTIPVVYTLLISVLIFTLFLKNFSGEEPNPAIFVAIVPLHLFSMFCTFYCLYFNAKALKSVEWQEPVTFSDFAGEFFLIWFFPIGIWIIQPRLNKLFDSTLIDENV